MVLTGPRFYFILNDMLVVILHCNKGNFKPSDINVCSSCNLAASHHPWPPYSSKQEIGYNQLCDSGPTTLVRSCGDVPCFKCNASQNTSGFSITPPCGYIEFKLRSRGPKSYTTNLVHQWLEESCPCGKPDTLLDRSQFVDDSQAVLR